MKTMKKSVFSKVHYAYCFDCVTAKTRDLISFVVFIYSTWYQSFVLRLRHNKIDYLYLLPLSIGMRICRGGYEYKLIMYLLLF